MVRARPTRGYFPVVPRRGGQGEDSGSSGSGVRVAALGCNIGGVHRAPSHSGASVLAVHSWKMHDNYHRQVERLPKPGGTPRRRRQLG